MIQSSRPASIADVARRAGVSAATVSRALSGSTPVVAATRQVVLAAAQELGYVPDARFRLIGGRKGQRRSQTGMIGIVMATREGQDPATSPYLGRLYWSVEQAVSASGRHLVISRVDEATLSYLPNLVQDTPMDGVLLVSLYDEDLIARVGTLLPTALVNAPGIDSGVSGIMPDEASGIRKALDLLRRLGHRRIFYFDIADSPIPNPHHSLRAQAFTVGGAGVLPEARAIVLRERAGSLLDTCREYLARWLDEGGMPTAILCGADAYALAFLEAAPEFGLRVPDDLSVVGADDMIECAYSRPRLTSIRQPFEAMGELAVDLLLDIIEKPDMPRQTRYLDVELVERGSCAPPRTEALVRAATTV